MKKIISVLFLMAFVFLPLQAVSAQSSASVIHTTQPVDAEVRSAVDAWLATDAPVDVPYYAITYSHARGNGTFVSLVALNIADPNQEWHFTDSDDIAWMGSVLVASDYSVELLTVGTGGGGVQARPMLAPGGGAEIRFPWTTGSAMMFGVRGVHELGYGTTGMEAVDFVGGDGMGSGVASPRVYAAAIGTVDYVCADATSVAVRTHNEDSGNYFIYAHLLDNDNLVEWHVFQQGDLIGALKYGAFDDECGWASQKPTQYHLHFGFEPAGGTYRMEGCILTVSTSKWMCGTKEIGTGQFLISEDTGSCEDTTCTTVAQAGMFDYFLSGIIYMWNKTIVQALPSHQVMQFTNVLYSTVQLVLRLNYAMIYSNVNLRWFISAVALGLAFKFNLAVAEFVVFLFKTWKSLMPIIGA